MRLFLLLFMQILKLRWIVSFVSITWAPRCNPLNPISVRQDRKCRAYSCYSNLPEILDDHGLV